MDCTCPRPDRAFGRNRLHYHNLNLCLAGNAQYGRYAVRRCRQALPQAYDALEPHTDARTLRLHHYKHHAGYVRGLNG